MWIVPKTLSSFVPDTAELAFRALINKIKKDIL